MSFELTVEEIVKSVQGKSFPDTGINEVRYVPKIVSETAQSHLDETNNITKTISYVMHAFHIYRETVCMGFFAPHMLVDDAYEWPSPSMFSWDKIEAVIYGGEFIHGPILEEDSSIVISTEEGDKVKEQHIEVDGETRFIVRDLVPHKDEIHKVFTYKIDNLQDVCLPLQQDWQNASLRDYVNPMYWLLRGFAENEIAYEDARYDLQRLLTGLRESHM